MNESNMKEPSSSSRTTTIMNRRRYHSYTDTLVSSPENHPKNDITTTTTRTRTRTSTKHSTKDANHNTINNSNYDNVIGRITIVMSIVWFYWNWFVLDDDGIVLEWNLYFGLIWYICDLLHFDYDTIMVVQIFFGVLSIVICFFNEPSYIYSSSYT